MLEILLHDGLACTMDMPSLDDFIMDISMV
jgi:hypothetical protein